MRSSLQNTIVVGVAAFLAACNGSHSSSSLLPTSAGRAHSNSVSEKVLHSFAGGKDGSYPYAAPLAVKGMVYGTTVYGGGGSCSGYRLQGCGTVYSIDASGGERVLHAFRGGKDGAAPYSSLSMVNGTLVGTTSRGGNYGCKNINSEGCGTIFDTTTSGRERILYRFTGNALGALPESGLTVFHGALYGSAMAGGTGNCSFEHVGGCGVVFEMQGLQAPAVVYAFQGGSEGAAPQGQFMFYRGNLYGTTTAGGATACDDSSSSGFYGIGCGTAFAINSRKRETTLHRFGQTLESGAFPESGLVSLGDALYGTTLDGGSNNCALSGYVGCGTVFRLAPTGRFESLYAFTTAIGGTHPNGLTVVNGKLYGTTNSNYDGGYGCGTVFEITHKGEETTIYYFGGRNDGCHPSSSLTYANGKLYGTTAYGGAHDDGTVFAITL